MLQILLIVSLVLCVWLVTASWFAVNALQSPLSRKEPTKKQVRFNPIVKITSAGGYKKDRYNPDLRETVARNAQLAASVGSAKKLADMSLLESKS